MPYYEISCFHKKILIYIYTEMNRKNPSEITFKLIII